MEVVFDLRASGKNGLRGKFRLVDCGGFLRLDVGFGMDSIKILLKKDALDDLVLELTENFPKRQENEARKKLEETLDELKRSGIDPRELAKTLRIEQLTEEEGEEKPEVDPGPGYRLLQDGETLLEGDEVYKKGSGVWEPTQFRSHVVGAGCLQGNVYRRKLEDLTSTPITQPAEVEAEKKPAVDPGAGYRLLLKGETLLSGDEFFHHMSQSWRTTKFTGHLVGGSPVFTNVYRRKVDDSTAASE